MQVRGVGCLFPACHAFRSSIQQTPGCLRRGDYIVRGSLPLQYSRRTDRHMRLERGRRNLTMRSSGPRGHSIVFPAVLSARGRLTRR
jgi:hypothetical protein